MAAEAASRRAVAGVLSALIPGLGLFVRYRWKYGLLVLLSASAFLIAAVLIFGLTPEDSLAGMIGSLACLAAALALYIFGIVLSVQKEGPAPASVVSRPSEPEQASESPVDQSCVMPADEMGGAFEGKSCVLVRRVPSMRDMLRAYTVLLDGVQAARLHRSGEAKIPVTPGHHTIAVAIDWCSSPALEFDVQVGHKVSFECGSGLTGWRILFWWWYTWFAPDIYLWVRLAGETG